MDKPTTPTPVSAPFNAAEHNPAHKRDLLADMAQREQRINLGPNCAKCMCARCPLLLDCGTMCGNTAGYCVTDCRGEDGYTEVCGEGTVATRKGGATNE